MIGLTSRFAAFGRVSAKLHARSGDRDWSRPRLPWPLPALPGLLIAGVILFGWWRLTQAQLAIAAPPGGVLFVSTFAIVARIFGNALEALWYVMVWRAFGQRLPLVRMFVWILLLSGFDLLAMETRQRSLGAEGAVPMLVAAIAGIGTLPGSWLPRAFHAAFASAGLLTLTRILVTARAQSLGTQVPLARTFALTLATWFVSHLALAFGYGLLQGRSLPGLP